MAQAGYSPIILFHSSTASNAPTTANLAVGELAINVADGKLYYTDGATVSYFASSTATVNLASNLAGGGALQLPYQSAANTTSFLAAPTVSGQVLTYDGTTLTWAAPAAATSLVLAAASTATNYLVMSTTATGASSGLTDTAVTVDATTHHITGGIAGGTF